ncbi:MAG: arylsulfatase [Pirellulaceae bacterium]|jgi:arylsulfatase|nr:arylsulfatase [Pirellulaceae bacterium]MDP7019472.1 arylsulfatase [Pirellulaceae bacterium]
MTQTSAIRALALALVVFAASAVFAADRPNIVIIMADDMGYSDIGCFGGEIRTPHLDQLAGDGLRFTNFYSENMCWVSRAALLTGVYHKTSMVGGAVHKRCETLPEALRRGEYQTRMSGKWHLAGKPYHVFPVDRGYDEFYGILGGAASFFAPAYLTRNRRNVDEEALDDPDYYITDAISDEAVRMIREAKTDKPLYLSVAYTAAHWPLHARQKDIAQYRGKYAIGWDKLREQRLARMKQLGIVPSNTPLSPRHPNVQAWEDADHKQWQQRRMEVYAAQITVMDTGIGRIVQALKETRRLENTLLLFTIDNGGCHVEYTPNRKGDYLPEKTRDGRQVRPGNLPEIMPGPEDTYQSYGYGWANASNTPYRYFKQFDHEGGIRTSMVAHWPQGIKRKGALVRGVTHLVDIMPTVLEITKTPAANQSIEMDGESFATAFGQSDHAGRQTMFFDHARGRALRRGHWKIVATKNGKRFNWELYNLKHDPLELNNLAKLAPEKVAELSAIWKAESARHARQAKLE